MKIVSSLAVGNHFYDFGGALSVHDQIAISPPEREVGPSNYSLVVWQRKSVIRTTLLLLLRQTQTREEMAINYSAVRDSKLLAPTNVMRNIFENVNLRMNIYLYKKEAAKRSRRTQVNKVDELGWTGTYAITVPVSGPNCQLNTPLGEENNNSGLMVCRRMC